MQVKKVVFLYMLMASTALSHFMATQAHADICPADNTTIHIDKVIDESGNYKFLYCLKLCEPISEKTYTRSQLEAERDYQNNRKPVMGWSTVGGLAGGAGVMLASTKAPGLLYPGIIVAAGGMVAMSKHADAEHRVELLNIILNKEDKPGHCSIVAYKPDEIRKYISEMLADIDERPAHILGDTLEYKKKAKSENIAKVETDKKEVKANKSDAPKSSEVENSLISKIGAKILGESESAKMAR